LLRAFPLYAHDTLKDGTFIYNYPKPAITLTCKLDLDKKVVEVTHVDVRTVPAPLLFISYSRKDKEWLAQLRKFLNPLEKDELVKIWYDRKIEAGDLWGDEIQNALSAAEMALSPPAPHART
jgi:TIR domain